MQGRRRVARHLAQRLHHPQGLALGQVDQSRELTVDQRTRDATLRQAEDLPAVGGRRRRVDRLQHTVRASTSAELRSRVDVHATVR